RWLLERAADAARAARVASARGRAHGPRRPRSRLLPLAARERRRRATGRAPPRARVRLHGSAARRHAGASHAGALARFTRMGVRDGTLRLYDYAASVNCYK